MDKITSEEFEFLRRTTSLYEALCLSSTDPVTIVNRIETRNGTFQNQPMIYNCYGDGSNSDLEIGEEIMKKRIKGIGDHDIIRHNNYHLKFLGFFEELDKTIDINDRINFSSITRELCDSVREYMIKVVKPHKNWFTEKRYPYPEGSFLDYPYFLSDYSFQIINDDRIGSLRFNHKYNLSCANNDLSKIVQLSESFTRSGSNIPIKKFLNYYEGVDLMDTSLRGRYDLNKELLKRIKFNLENPGTLSA